MNGRIVSILDDYLQSIFRPSFDTLSASGCKVTLHERFADIPPELAAAADVVVVPGDVPMSGDMLGRFPHARSLISPFTGIEGFDLGAASARGIAVANGHSRENSESLAEATILMLLAALYDLRGAEAVLRDGLPRQSPSARRMLSGRTIGIIGFGQVGKAVTRRLEGWDAKILIHTRTIPDDRAHLTFVGIDELVQHADIILLLAGLNANNRHMLDALRLASMKPDCVLVNMARGGLVDEAALAHLLAERPAMRAALDVFEVEPLPQDSPLRTLPNAILTPHMLSHTHEAVESLPLLLVENIASVLAGRLPLCLCNTDVAPTWLARWGSPNRNTG